MELEQPLANYGNPQKEDGYTPIANELLEAILKADFSKRQLLVIMTVARMTYGYSKKSDALSGWQIASMTGIDRSHVSKTINELVDLRVLKKLETGRQSHGIFVHEVSINKLYNEWITVADLATVAKTAPLPIHRITVAETATQPLLKQPTHKAIKTTKESIAKNSSLKTSIPSNFGISERVKKWAIQKGYYNLEAHLEHFILACEGKNYKYANWDSAFMTAIKDNWAKVQNKKPNGVVL